MPEPTFKPYRQNQMRLLPLDLSEMVPENHMARVVDEVVESLDLSALRSLYPGGGAPAHDPRMMLKVVIYAYASGVYSSRRIAEATRSNVYFLWLTGCTPLDHMTVSWLAYKPKTKSLVEPTTNVGRIALWRGPQHAAPRNCSHFVFLWARLVLSGRSHCQLQSLVHTAAPRLAGLSVLRARRMLGAVRDTAPTHPARHGGKLFIRQLVALFLCKGEHVLRGLACTSLGLLFGVQVFEDHVCVLSLSNVSVSAYVHCTRPIWQPSQHFSGGPQPAATSPRLQSWVSLAVFGL